MTTTNTDSSSTRVGLYPLTTGKLPKPCKHRLGLPYRVSTWYRGDYYEVACELCGETFDDDTDEFCTYGSG